MDEPQENKSSNTAIYLKRLEKEMSQANYEILKVLHDAPFLQNVVDKNA